MKSNLINNPEDWTGKNIQGENLARGKFNNYNFSCSLLNGADLSNSDFKGANFQKAEMRGVNLTNAQLYGADLSFADLSGADLRRADLRGATLSGANLSGTKLSEIDLSGAKVRKAILSRSTGLEPEDINDLKQRGAIFESTLNPNNSANDERKKWWIQFVVTPLLIALIGAGVAIVNIYFK
jgi:uncharacterized protein YjbI with pentapeptide repeats